MTETGGEVGLVRDLPGVAPEPVRALVGALTALEAGFADFAAALEAGCVHEHAFGKLIDAAKVRDAYHQRLPATRVNLAEAAEVAHDLLAEFAAPAAGGPAAQAPADAPAPVPSPVPSQREAGE